MYASKGDRFAGCQPGRVDLFAQQIGELLVQRAVGVSIDHVHAVHMGDGDQPLPIDLWLIVAGDGRTDRRRPAAPTKTLLGVAHLALPPSGDLATPVYSPRCSWSRAAVSARAGQGWTISDMSISYAPGAQYCRLARTTAHRWWRPVLGTLAVVALGFAGIAAVVMAGEAAGVIARRPVD